MSYVSTEIESQPSAWRRALELVPSVVDALPQRG